jgi:hypothetical protein
MSWITGYSTWQALQCRFPLTGWSELRQAGQHQNVAIESFMAAVDLLKKI